MFKKLGAIALLGVLCAVGQPALAADATPDMLEPGADGVTAPYLIPTSRVTPSYPPAALKAGFDGAVLVRATVLADGTVGDVEVVDSSRQKLGFEKAAISAVKQWRFEPARQGGASVVSQTVARLRFNPPGSNGAGGSIATDFAQPDIADHRAYDGLNAARRGFGAGSASLASFVSGASPSDGNHTAASDSQMDRLATYGKPPCASGCLYSREDLIPPTTYGLAVAGANGR